MNSLAERRAQEQLTPVYQQRREALKSIPKFWPVALLKHSLFALQAQHDADRLALSYLEDVWVVRDPREPKVFTLEFVRLVVITEFDSMLTRQHLVFQGKSLFQRLGAKEGVQV